jgi:RND family efflux transporter MFP subunit
MRTGKYGHDRMRVKAIMVASCSFMLLMTVGCAKSADETEKAVVADVTLTKVKRGDISEVLTLSGAISATPNNDIKVSSLVPGRIAEMKVAEGDRVKKGEQLGLIDQHTYQDQLTQAEAATAQAKANLDNATASRTRNEDLFQRGISSRKDLEDARLQESVAQAALKQAEAGLSIAKLQMSRTAVISPIDGIVVKRFVGVGEQVDGTAGQPVIEVANLDQVELVVNVPASALGNLHRDEPLALVTDAFPDKEFPGQVLAIPGAVDPATNAGAVRIRSSNPHGLLRLGMFLKADLPIAVHRNTLLIPVPALYHDETNKPIVYLVEGDTATATDIKTGIVTEERVEILEGVKEGDTIVLTGGYGLGEKSKIKSETAK